MRLGQRARPWPSRRETVGSHNYTVQPTWSNATSACAMSR